MTIPLIDLRAQYRAIKREVDAAIQSVLDRGQFVLGPEVEAFEREMAAYCGTSHAVAVASGTDALELALRASGIGPGDEVLTTALSFIAVPEAILAVGATPVFADIDPTTYTLDLDDAARRVTPRTTAILPVHLYGHPCAMDRLGEFAAAHKLRVIEDCAQAIGAGVGGRRVGGFGDAGCLSFYPSKNLGAYGDGGMVVTNDGALAERVRLLRNHGQTARYHHDALGTNSRLDELQAAVLRVKLRHLESWNEARRRHADAYAASLQRHGLSEVQAPRERPGCRHVYTLYTVRALHRDRLARHLADQGIATQVAYPMPLTAQPALAKLGMKPATCPQAEAVCRDILALPMYAELEPGSIERVADALAAALRVGPRARKPLRR